MEGSWDCSSSLLLMARRADDDDSESDGIGIDDNGFLDMLDDRLVQVVENGWTACRVMGVHQECTPCTATAITAATAISVVDARPIIVK